MRVFASITWYGWSVCRMVSRPLVWSWMVFAVLLLGRLIAAQSGPSLDVGAILSRMSQARRANQIRLRCYRVKRDYRIWDGQAQSKAQMVADITFLPPGPARYRIESSSGGLGEKVLRDILDRETSPTPEVRYDISLENYEVRLAGLETLNGRP